jgi:hypothetical protein
VPIRTFDNESGTEGGWGANDKLKEGANTTVKVALRNDTGFHISGHKLRPNVNRCLFKPCK